MVRLFSAPASHVYVLFRAGLVPKNIHPQKALLDENEESRRVYDHTSNSGTGHINFWFLTTRSLKYMWYPMICVNACCLPVSPFTGMMMWYCTIEDEPYAWEHLAHGVTPELGIMMGKRMQCLFGLPGHLRHMFCFSRFTFCDTQNLFVLVGTSFAYGPLEEVECREYTHTINRYW